MNQRDCEVFVVSESNGVRVLERAITILTYISSRQKPVGLSELSRSTGISKATAFRMLSTLAERDLVVKDSGGFYQMGPGVLGWASSFRKQSALVELARPRMEEVNRETFETVHLFSFDRGKAFYIDKIESPQQVRLQAVVGVSPRLYSTSAGRAILASLSAGELDRYLAATPLEPRTPYTCTDPVEFRAIIDAARINGYAEEDQQNEEGIRCVGAAILDGNGYPLGAISVTAPRYRFTDEMVKPFGIKVRAAAACISKRFGCAPND